MAKQARGDAAQETIDARKVARTADAIIALFCAYEPPAVIFFKTLDNILNALSSPLGLRLGLPPGTQSLFDTRGLGKSALTSEAVTFCDCLWIAVAKNVRRGESDEVTMRTLNGARDFLGLLSEQLLEAEARGEITELKSRLKSGFDSARSSPDSEGLAAAPGVTEDVARQQLHDFSERLAAFLNRPNYKLQLPGASAERPCPRLLLLHRYVAPSGAPAVRLNLFESQKNRLAAVFGEGEALSERLRATEEAFRELHWDIDSVFRSGVTRWLEWPWQRGASGKTPSSLATARETIAALAAGQRGGKEALLSPLVIPVHVDGLPWLTFAAIMPETSPAAASWAHYFYRDILPYVTTTIRAAAERVYLREVRRLGLADLTAGPGDLAGLTASLGSLAATFPYSRIIVSNSGEEGEEGKAEELSWRGERALVKAAPLGFESGRVAYTRLDLKGVVSALSDAQGEYNQARIQTLEKRMSSYIDIGHTLKNVVSSTGWAEASEKVAVAHQNFDVIRQKGFIAQDASLIEQALSYADRSLSLFWNVEGLGHFIRLAGAQSGKFEWSKFQSWFDDRTPVNNDVSGRVLHAYYAGVKHVAETMCFGWDWKMLTVTRDGERAVCKVDGAPAFRVEDLHFPPFVKGSEGGYAIVFCLVEPIVNALRALGATPADSPARLDPDSLRIGVMSDPDDPSAVVVRVTNWSVDRVREKLSGLESTKHMMRDMGIGEFDPPGEAIQLGNGYFEIHQTLRFRPSRIAKVMKQPEEA